MVFACFFNMPVARLKKSGLSALRKTHALKKDGLADHVLVIAGSAGGISALGSLLEDLPSHLEAAIVIAQHVSRYHPSHLAEILARQTFMPVRQAADDDVLRHGCIFVAPPDHHLLIEMGGVLRLSTSPRIHFTRPSAEPLFCSAAAIYGKHAIGVVLTGSDSDASLGVQVIKNAGGKIIVQNEATAVDFSMPRAAIATGKVDMVLPLCQIAGAIVETLAMAKKKLKNHE
jgi:two-component system chemotaxis response regulator CheB